MWRRRPLSRRFRSEGTVPQRELEGVRVEEAGTEQCQSHGQLRAVPEKGTVSEEATFCRIGHGHRRLEALVEPLTHCGPDGATEARRKSSMAQGKTTCSSAPAPSSASAHRMSAPLASDP
jgi:hypothetical protein